MRLINKKSVPYFAVNALALTINTLAQAAETEQVLSEVVVTGTRTSNPLAQVPASISVATKDDFSTQQATSVGEVLRKLPNVDFGGGPRPDGQIPTIRGSQGNDIILMVDGARRNANYSLTTPLFIDPYFISRVEVARGPASNYGSGGLGGAMAFTTLRAKDVLRPGESYGGEIKTTNTTGDNTRKLNGRVQGSNGIVDFLVAGGTENFDDIRLPNDAKLLQSNGSGSSSLVKVGLEPTTHLRIEVSSKDYKRNAWEYNNPQLASGNLQMTHNSQSESTLSLTTLSDRGDKALEIRLFDSRTENQRDANTTVVGTSALPYPYWKSTIRTNGVSAQNSHWFDAVGVHRVTYGYDTYEDRLHTVQGTTAQPNVPSASAVNPDGKENVSGVFLQDEALLNDWRIISSIRVDSYKAIPGNTALAGSHAAHTSPKVAVAWEGIDKLNLYGSLGQAFRAPTVWELYMNSNAVGFRRFAPNPNLQPQVDTTLEFGAHWEEKRLWFNDDRLALHGAIFQSRVENLIQQVTIEGTPGAFNSKLQYQNVTQATKKGFELSAKYAAGSWLVNAGFSRVRITDDSNGNNLFSPPDKLATQISYDLARFNTAITWNGTAVAAQDYDTTVLRRRSGYFVHDLYATWQSPNKAYRVDFGISNLFNKQYVSYQQSQATALTAYEMERSLKLSLSSAF